MTGKIDRLHKASTILRSFSDTDGSATPDDREVGLELGLDFLTRGDLAEVRQISDDLEDDLQETSLRAYRAGEMRTPEQKEKDRLRRRMKAGIQFKAARHVAGHVSEAVTNGAILGPHVSGIANEQKRRMEHTVGLQAHEMATSDSHYSKFHKAAVAKHASETGASHGAVAHAMAFQGHALVKSFHKKGSESNGDYHKRLGLHVVKRMGG